MMAEKAHYPVDMMARLEARSAAIDWVERVYNRFRPHSIICDRVPAEAMAALWERTDPASSVTFGATSERATAA